jgi:hypothetical protein
MNAGLSLHVALSLRHDAIEAYRLAHAYRDEEFQKYADRLASRASLYGDSATVAEVIKDLRSIATQKARREDEATPDFFQAGRTYTRQCHGDTAEFLVECIGAEPEFGDRQAFGWYRRQPRTSWHPYSQNEAEFTVNGWTLVAEAGGVQ